SPCPRALRVPRSAPDISADGPRSTREPASEMLLLQSSDSNPCVNSQRGSIVKSELGREAAPRWLLRHIAVAKVVIVSNLAQLIRRSAIPDGDNYHQRMHQLRGLRARVPKHSDLCGRRAMGTQRPDPSCDLAG